MRKICCLALLVVASIFVIDHSLAALAIEYGQPEQVKQLPPPAKGKKTKQAPKAQQNTNLTGQGNAHHKW
jgi:hypothetical protein